MGLGVWLALRVGWNMLTWWLHVRGCSLRRKRSGATDAASPSSQQAATRWSRSGSVRSTLPRSVHSACATACRRAQCLVPSASTPRRGGWGCPRLLLAVPVASCSERLYPWVPSRRRSRGTSRCTCQPHRSLPSTQPDSSPSPTYRIGHSSPSAYVYLSMLFRVHVFTLGAGWLWSLLLCVACVDHITQGIKKLNRLQSELYHAAFHTNDNLLVCAPTGAGKTNVAMLTVCHELGNNFTHGVLQKDQFKIVYVAPMKALAQEVVRKFGGILKPLGISVRELTGDMQLTKAEIAKTQIIVTTPEKWDVITRKAGEGSLVQSVRLLIIDEVHLLADERGAVIESIVARTLRMVETSQMAVRIVGLSATLPNYTDVALFLRVHPDRGLFHFGGAYRYAPGIVSAAALLAVLAVPYVLVALWSCSLTGCVRGCRIVMCQACAIGANLHRRHGTQHAEAQQPHERNRVRQGAACLGAGQAVHGLRAFSQGHRQDRTSHPRARREAWENVAVQPIHRGQEEGRW